MRRAEEAVIALYHPLEEQSLLSASCQIARGAVCLPAHRHSAASPALSRAAAECGGADARPPQL
jgi:hypothetical protein